MMRIARLWLYWLCVGAAGRVALRPALAQDAPTPTLHVYANTIQLPVLVLSAAQEPINPIAAKRFAVSLDGGPWFRATHVRREGEDPISLAILLDVNGSGAELMSKMPEALAALAPGSLHAQDRVSIYVLGCLLVRSLDDVPAEAESLRKGTDAALAWKAETLREHGRKCARKTSLWDALAYMTGALQSRPGRRVILAITAGGGKGGIHSPRAVRTFAQAEGVAVFGVIPIVNLAFSDLSELKSENTLHFFCEMTGGMAVSSNEGQLQRTLSRFTETLRERYIVEFPRPYNVTRGAHGLVVRIDKSGDDFIRPGGISVPIPDPATLSDPMTIPQDPTKTPRMGPLKNSVPRS